MKDAPENPLEIAKLPASKFIERMESETQRELRTWVQNNHNMLSNLAITFDNASLLSYVLTYYHAPESGYLMTAVYAKAKCCCCYLIDTFPIEPPFSASLIHAILKDSEKGIVNGFDTAIPFNQYLYFLAACEHAPAVAHSLFRRLPYSRYRNRPAITGLCLSAISKVECLSPYDFLSQNPQYESWSAGLIYSIY